MLFFKFNNRNKYGVDLDLKIDEGCVYFLEFVNSVDIVVENFWWGVMDCFGFNFEILWFVNLCIFLVFILG